MLARRSATERTLRCFFYQHKARTGSEKLEKKVKINGETRRDIDLTGDDSGDVGDTWKETDEIERNGEKGGGGDLVATSRAT